MKGLKIAIVGSREDNDYERFCSILNYLHKIYKLFDNVYLIISGGALGADSMAETWAKENNYKTKIYEVTQEDWKKLGRAAGPIRNQKIVDKMDIMIALPKLNSDGSYSKGTNDSIRKAQLQHKKCYIVV